MGCFPGAVDCTWRRGLSKPAYTHARADGDSSTHIDTYTNADSYSYPDTVAYTYARTDGDAHRNRNAHSYSDSHSDTNADGFADPLANSDTNAGGFADPLANSNPLANFARCVHGSG